jgi:hypothetical protein
MSVFTPPSVEDTPYGQKDEPSYYLMRYYGGEPTGLTIWRDQGGVYHQSLYPYQGGDETFNFDNGVLVSHTGPIPGLATATEIYQGGHVYQVDNTTALDLIVAGYGGYLNHVPLDVLWDANFQVGNLWTRRVISQDGDAAFSLQSISSEGVGVLTKSGGPVTASNQREWWAHDWTTGWTDFECQTQFKPRSFTDTPLTNPQHGLVGRIGNDGTSYFGVAAWHDIAFLSPAIINIGVCYSNIAAPNLVFRSVNHTFPPGVGFLDKFPINLGFRVIGTTATIRFWTATMPRPEWTDPIWSFSVDLNSFGDTVGLPTPTQGQAGYWLGHGGNLVQSYPRFGLSYFKRPGDNP